MNCWGSGNSACYLNQLASEVFLELLRTGHLSMLKFFIFEKASCIQHLSGQITLNCRTLAYFYSHSANANSFLCPYNHHYKWSKLEYHWSLVSFHQPTSRFLDKKICPKSPGIRGRFILTNFDQTQQITTIKYRAPTQVQFSKNSISFYCLINALSIAGRWAINF